MGRCAIGRAEPYWTLRYWTPFGLLGAPVLSNDLNDFKDLKDFKDGAIELSGHCRSLTLEVECLVLSVESS